MKTQVAACEADANAEFDDLAGNDVGLPAAGQALAQGRERELRRRLKRIAGAST